MNDELMKYYLSQVPVEIREAVMELDSNQKWAIYIALSLEGQKYFNEIKNQFKANANTIDPILKSLVAGGLVTKRVKQLNDIGDQGRIYYTTSKLGLELLDALYEVALPPTSMKIRALHQQQEHLTLQNQSLKLDTHMKKETTHDTHYAILCAMINDTYKKAEAYKGENTSFNRVAAEI
jgi:DNA-binding HxlR family transcriptional regulator